MDYQKNIVYLILFNLKPLERISIYKASQVIYFNYVLLFVIFIYTFEIDRS